MSWRLLGADTKAAAVTGDLGAGAGASTHADASVSVSVSVLGSVFVAVLGVWSCVGLVLDV